MKKTSSNHNIHPYLKPGFINPIDQRNQKPGLPLPTMEQVREMVKRNNENQQ